MFAGLSTLGCKTDQNHPEDRTKAALIIFGDFLQHIAATVLGEFDPANFGEFRAFVVDRDFFPNDEYLFGCDGWRHPYRLFVSKDGNRAYLVNSAGPDGQHGTSDDLRVVVEFPPGDSGASPKSRTTQPATGTSGG